MAWRPHDKAICNPSAPSCWGTCDRCGGLWNLNRLGWEVQWYGTEIKRTGFRVCPPCLDVPAAFLKAITLPADPEPAYQPRPEPYTADEAGGGGAQHLTWDSGGFWDQPGENWDA